MAAGYDIGQQQAGTGAFGPASSADQFYLRIVDADLGTVFGGFFGAAPPQPGMPNWAGFPGDNAAAIVDYLTTLLTNLTGDAPDPYADPFLIGGKWAIQYTDPLNFLMADRYEYQYGTLAIPVSANGRSIEYQLRRIATNEDAPFWVPLMDTITDLGENPNFVVTQLKSIE